MGFARKRAIVCALMSFCSFTNLDQGVFSVSLSGATRVAPDSPAATRVKPNNVAAGGDCICAQPGVPLFGPSPTGAPPFDVFSIPMNLQAPMYHYFHASFQREVFRSNAVTISYVGSRGMDQILARDINAPIVHAWSTASERSSKNSSGSTGSAAPPPATGIDPKDRIALANALHAAELAVDDGAFQKAIPLLEHVVASEPNVKLAQLQLGVSRAHQKQYARAVRTARQSDRAGSRRHVRALRARGRAVRNRRSSWRGGRLRGRRAAPAGMGRCAIFTRLGLGPHRSRLRSHSRATRCVQIEPQHFRANLLLGRVLTLQGHPDEALTYLRATVAVEPTNAEARQFLNDALVLRRR
jgi:tetratricopeptide (TPR) repeat protein